MANRDDRDEATVALCVRKLDLKIGELAKHHGTASVAAALTEIVGCSWCARSEASRGSSIKALMARIGIDKGTPSN